MLVLSRRRKESIVVGDRITVTVVEIRGNQVRLAIEAPKEIRVLRTELVDTAVARVVAA
jgi:carbon storage regulator